MLSEGKPDLIVAFHNDLANSKGTKDTITRALRTGIPVDLITVEEGEIIITNLNTLDELSAKLEKVNG